jgi:BASS family bile acid:Na+ symporter
LSEQPVPAAAWLTKMVRSYPELLCVLAAAGIGLGGQAPLRWLASHQAINVLLAVLVLATAVTIAPGDLIELARSRRRMAVTLAVSAVVLPALSWAASRLVAAGTLRDGVLTVGLAPCEIASVATTAMAGGAAGFAAGMLVASTLVTVALAGTTLVLEAGSNAIHPAHVVVNLVVVVVLPLAVGLFVRHRVPRIERAAPAANITALAAVAALVALIASEVHLSSRYLPLVAALVFFVAASALMGSILGAGTAPGVRRAVLLTTSMRDFAIAAGLAAAAFGDCGCRTTRRLRDPGPRLGHRRRWRHPPSPTMTRRA